jgi:hypothetical protein
MILGRNEFSEDGRIYQFVGSIVGFHQFANIMNSPIIREKKKSKKPASLYFRETGIFVSDFWSFSKKIGSCNKGDRMIVIRSGRTDTKVARRDSIF